MLGARACRVLAGASAAPQSSTNGPVHPKMAKLSPESRLARWKMIVIKLMLVLRNFWMKQISQEILGRDTYRRLFQQINRTERPQASDQIVHKVINGEIVGEELKTGTKTPTTEALMCQHPMKSMKARGNKNEKWWTCEACQMRWKRIPLQENTGPPLATDLVTFGTKYVGRTYREVFADKEYSDWILRTAETEDHRMFDGLRRLALWLVSQEGAQVNRPENPNPEHLDMDL